MAKQTIFRSATEAEVLTLDEVARYLRVSRKTAYRMARSGELPAFKAANHWRIRRSELENWIKSQMGGGRSA